MELTEALKESSLVEHSSGRASVVVYEDFNFSIFTVDGISFLLSDLDTGHISVNGTPHALPQAQARIASVLRTHGITFESGWRPLLPARPDSARAKKTIRARYGCFASLLTGLLVLCWVWYWLHTTLERNHSPSLLPCDVH